MIARDGVAHMGHNSMRRVVYADTRPLAPWHRGIAAFIFTTRYAGELEVVQGFAALHSHLKESMSTVLGC